MKKSQWILTTAVCLIASVCFAKSPAASKATKKSGRVPTQAAPAPIQFRIVAGEKTSVFLVTPSKEGVKVQFQSGERPSQSREISQKDFTFLSESITSLKGVSNKLEFCPRSYIEVIGANRSLLGCLGAKNEMADEIQRLTSTLSLLF